MKPAYSKVLWLSVCTLLLLLIPALVVYAGGSKERERLKNELAACKEEADGLKKENPQLKSQIDTLNTQVSSLQVEKAALEEQVADLASQIEEKDRRIEELEAEIAELEAEAREPMVVSKTVEQRIQERDAQIVELKREKSELETELEDVTAELEEAQAENEALLDDNSSLQEEVDSLTAENESLAEEVDSLAAEIEALTEEVDSLTAENEALKAEREELIGAEKEELMEQIAQLEAEKAQLEEEKADLERLIETYEGIELKAKELMEVVYEEILTLLSDEIDAGKVNVYRSPVSIIVDIISEYMFNVGSVEINSSGKLILGKIVPIFSEFDGYLIGVIGNADNKPIVTPALKKRFGTNWELSAHRGAVVVRHLVEKGNLDPGRMVAMGFGEYQPIEDNSTTEGRNKNRRIDIMLLPMDVLSAVVLGAQIR